MNKIKQVLQKFYRYFFHKHLDQFYSPLPDLIDVKSRAENLFQKDVELGSDIDLKPDCQEYLLRELANFYDEFKWAEECSANLRFNLQQSYFCHGDAISLYGILRHLRPQHVVEVGSGFSSALMLDTDELFLGSSVSFTFIEPYPARLFSIMKYKDHERCCVVKDKVQNVSLSIFKKLEKNDFLFIDSSHVSKIGSDLNFLLFEVLPILKQGVIVHFHDIFWPFEYPKDWVLMRGRAWNEAYLLRAFLQYNSYFEILLFNSYVAYRFPSFFKTHMPQFLKNTGGSIWLRRV